MLRWRCIRTWNRCSKYAYSTVNPSKLDVNGDAADEKINDKPTIISSKNSGSLANNSKLVAAAFASLNEISLKSKGPSSAAIDQMIASANDIHSLLAAADGPIIARRQALKIVSVLSEWTQQGKIRLSDIEADLRFAKICKILGGVQGAGSKEDMADLSIVLGVTADEQAAKLVSSIGFKQMIKILVSLGQRKRRSTPLLRSLSYNIGQASEHLDIKEASDVLYACASLSYPDDILLEKTAIDIPLCLKNTEKPAVVCSIINSIGILRYRDTDLLNHLCDWLVENKSLCRTRDFVSMTHTLATVNYVPAKFPELYEILKTLLTELEMNDASAWVDIVWSLIVLNKSEAKLIDSVLKPDFISKLKPIAESTDITVALKLKLLNINGSAKLLGSKYKGHFLDSKSDIFDVLLKRSKEKQVVLDSVLETISNIVKIPDYIKVDIDTGMGFVIDSECLLNSKREFVKLSDANSSDITKVAIMTCCYHDMCRGCLNEPTGLFSLTQRMIEGSGYKVLSVPYTEYNPKEKLMARVHYLNQKLKDVG